MSFRSTRAFLPLVALCAAAPSFAQGDTPDAAIMEKIRNEGLNRSQYAQTLSYLTDVIGPRLTGSPGLLRANNWVKDQLAKQGFEAKLEPWGPFGRGWTLERFSLQTIAPTPFPIIAVPKAWSTAWSGTAEVVYVNAASAEELDKFKGKLKGKIALISPIRAVPAHFTPQGTRYTDTQLESMANGTTPGQGRPRQQGAGGGNPFGGGGGEMTPEMRTRIAQMTLGPRLLAFCKAEGAVAVLDSARGDGGTIFVQQASVPSAQAAAPPTTAPGTRQPNARPRVQPYKKAAEKLMIPQIAVSVEHYNRLVRMVEAGESVKLALDMKVAFNGSDDSMVFNTSGEWKGTDKADEIVMAGGHLDSWHGGTGATDDACGVVVAMEAVRILKAIGVKPRRTIRVAAWTGEEQGIFGSAGYVKEHFGTATEPKPEHAKLAAYFNLDNGTGKIRGIYAQGNASVMPIFSQWLTPFADLGATTVTLRSTGGTDHLSFQSVGLPGFQFIQDTIEYDARTHHSNMDVFDRIQIEDMKQASVLMAAFLYNAAMRDEKLPRK